MNKNGVLMHRPTDTTPLRYCMQRQNSRQPARKDTRTQGWQGGTGIAHDELPPISLMEKMQKKKSMHASGWACHLPLRGRRKHARTSIGRALGR